MRPRYFSARLAACRAAILVLGFVPFWAPALAHAGTARSCACLTRRSVSNSLKVAIAPGDEALCAFDCAGPPSRRAHRGSTISRPST